MNKILTFTYMFLLGSAVFAQDRQIVGSTGQNAELGGIFYSYTVGEIVVTTVTDNNLTLTQGFQQPQEVACAALTTTLEPVNPTEVCKDGTEDNLTFTNSAAGQIAVGEDYKYIITDTLGNIIQDLGAANSFNFDNLEPGSFRVYGISHPEPITLGADLTSIEGNCFLLTNNFLQIAVNEGPSEAIIESPEEGSEICGNTSVELSATAPTFGEGMWSGPAGVTFAPNNTSPNVTASGVPGGEVTFTWTVSSPGCGTATEKSVTFNFNDNGSDPPEISPGDTVICEGAALTVNGTPPGADETGEWSASNNVTFSPDRNSPTITLLDLPLGETVLTWAITSPECGTSSSSITVTVNNDAVDVLGDDVTICQGDPAYTVIPMAQNYTIVAWSTGETTPTITVDPEAGTTETIAVELITSEGCTIMDAVNITRDDVTVEIESTPVCINDGELTPAKLSVPDTPGATYEWSTGETTSSIEVEQAGIYSVNVASGNNCASAGQVEVEMDSYVATVDPAEVKIGRGETVTLTASGGDEYTWTPEEGLSCTTCAAPEASPTATTTYTVVILRNSGCQETEQAKVEIGEGTCDILRVPNVITPMTRDGLNDEWTIGGLTPNSEVNIYDRWGGLIFQATDYQNDWVGLRNGTSQVVEAGTYYYVIRLTSGDVCRGSITVLK